MYRKLNIEESEMFSYKKELIEKPKLLVLDGTNKYFEIGEEYAKKYSSIQFLN